jgi:hypothetical protein
VQKGTHTWWSACSFMGDMCWPRHMQFNPTIELWWGFILHSFVHCRNHVRGHLISTYPHTTLKPENCDAFLGSQHILLLNHLSLYLIFVLIPCHAPWKLVANLWTELCLLCVMWTQFIHTANLSSCLTVWVVFFCETWAYRNCLCCVSYNYGLLWPHSPLDECELLPSFVPCWALLLSSLCGNKVEEAGCQACVQHSL